MLFRSRRCTTSNGAGIGNPIKDMVGSGPYYLSSYNIGTSYALTASPVPS